MKLEIVKLDEFCCRAGCLYSVAINDDEYLLYDHFLNSFNSDYHSEIKELQTRLKTMAGTTGFVDTYFKEEGSPDEGVYALYDKKQRLRLYCIRYGNCTLVVGGGGPKTTRTYQEDPNLNSAVEMMEYVSSVITENIKNKNIVIESDGTLSGQLIYEEDE